MAEFFDGSVVTYVITIMDTMRFWGSLDSSHHLFLLGRWFIGSVAFLGKSRLSQATLRVIESSSVGTWIQGGWFDGISLAGRHLIEIMWRENWFVGISLSVLFSFTVAMWCVFKGFIEEVLDFITMASSVKGIFGPWWSAKMQEPDLVRIVVNGASDHQCAAVQRIDTAGMTRQTTSNWWVINSTGMASPNTWQIIIAMGVTRSRLWRGSTHRRIDASENGHGGEDLHGG